MVGSIHLISTLSHSQLYNHFVCLSNQKTLCCPSSFSNYFDFNNIMSPTITRCLKVIEKSHQHCERSELCLHFEWTKVNQKRQEWSILASFKTWCLRSNSVTRQVIFDRTKLNFMKNETIFDILKHCVCLLFRETNLFGHYSICCAARISTMEFNFFSFIMVYDHSRFYAL